MDFHRRLEHSSRPGSAYFVTWRLDGSLPVTRVTDLWTSDGPKFVELDQLLDAVSTGPRWLERPDVAGVVANALWKGVRESRYELGAWVLMPNHVHLALRPLGDQDIGAAVRSIKGSSAHAANRLLHRSGSRFWARDRQIAAEAACTTATGTTRDASPVRQRAKLALVERQGKRSLKPRVPLRPGPLGTRHLCGSVQDWPWSSAGENAA
jgi:REP element-mobilizing transposase RayT